MKRIAINTLVDIGCLITFIPSPVSGLVLNLRLSGRRRAGERLDTVPGDRKKPVDDHAQ
jgi:hypothetical protein